MIHTRFNSEEGKRLISYKMEFFYHVINKLEEVYNIKPFNQQSAQSLTELYLIAKCVEPKTIIELGCGTRSSTIALTVAAQEISDCTVYGVDISPVNFPSLMEKHFPEVKYTRPIDFSINAVDFEIDPSWKKPILFFYDAHDDDIPGVKIFPYAQEHWFPHLENQILVIHDCSVSDDPCVDSDHYAAQHFSGKYIKGFKEVIPMTEWLNSLRLPFYRPNDELNMLGLAERDTSLIYVLL